MYTPLSDTILEEQLYMCHENVFQTEMVNNLTISHSAGIYILRWFTKRQR